VVTWDRSDSIATSYDVLRDGALLGTVAVSGDAWDDLSFTDRGVSGSRSYSYQVRAWFPDGTASNLSAAYSVYVRSVGDLGGGRVFDVDSYAGTDRQRAQAAVDAAKANGGGTVRFGPRTYSFDAPLLVTETNNVVLRGAGAQSTFLQPAFAGETTSCGAAGRLISFTGRLTRLANVLGASAQVGDRSVRMDSTSGLAVGQRIVLYEPVTGSSTLEYAAAGVIQDPGTGNDHRHRWDAHEIVAVDATARTVTFRFPLSQSFTPAAALSLMANGRGNGIERLTVQGRSASEATYYTLVNLSVQAGFQMADVEGRWANRNNLKTMSVYDTQVVGFKGPFGNPNNDWAATCQYKFSVGRSANFTFVAGEMGQPTDDNNLSFIMTQRAQRTLVRASKFWGTRTYAFNEHGGGSRHFVFENNYVAAGPNARKGAVFLGHSEFGFAGSGIIRY
jgi:hypothetical protein